MAENRVYNKFNFVCKLSIPKETDKFKPYKKERYDSGWNKEQLMITAKTDDSSVLLTLEGGYFDKDFKIKTYSKDEVKKDGTIVKGNKLEVAWNDRNKQSVISKIADFAKLTFDLSSNGERGYLQRKIEKIKDGKITQDELAEIQKNYETVEVTELEVKLTELEGLKKEFLSQIDLIDYIKKELPKYSEVIFRVSGDIEFSEFNGKVYRKFIPKTIEKAIDTKQVLKGQIDIFFNSSSLNEDTFEETKKYIVKAWTKNYDGQLKKDIYIPTLFIVDASRLDLNNPKHKSKLDFLIDELRVESGVYEIQYEVKFVSGAERKELTEDDLTEFQRKQIESGNTTFEEIKKRLGGNKLGSNIDEVRLININTIAYPNGRKETELSEEDFVIIRPDKPGTNASTDDEIKVDDDTEDLL